MDREQYEKRVDEILKILKSIASNADEEMLNVLDKETITLETIDIMKKTLDYYKEGYTESNKGEREIKKSKFTVIK